MKKHWMIIAMTISVLAFTACGEKAVQETKDASGTKTEATETEATETEAAETEDSYAEQTFILDDWEVTITNDYVAFDDYYKKDNLVVEYTATNKSGKEESFNGIANVIAYQNGENLGTGQLCDENGDFVSDYEQALKAVADGTTITGVKVYELIDTSEVTVNFGGYSSDIEDTQIVFEIESRATDEWKAALEQQAADLEAKQNMTGFDFDCVSGEIDKDNGWYVDVMDDEDVELCLTDTDATLTVYSDPDRESAQQWAEFKASGFQKGPESFENRTIGNANYILFPVNDTQFMLFADCSQGGAVMIYGMFTDLDQCMTQLEKIVVK